MNPKEEKGLRKWIAIMSEELEFEKDKNRPFNLVKMVLDEN